MTELLQAHSLLVIPSDDLRGMLEDGPCGFRPPQTTWPNFQAWDECGPNFRECPSGSPCSGFSGRERERCMDVVGACRGFNPRAALVLRWEGQDMPHGWVTAGMACGWPPSTCLPLTLTPQRRFLLSLEARGCTLIALDKQGKEMTDD